MSGFAHKHPLTTEYRPRGFRCDICKKSYGPQESKVCKQCNYDECTGCFPKNSGRSAVVAANCGKPHCHPLTRMRDPYKNRGVQGFTCDICKKAFTLTDNYHCMTCNYDECFICYPQNTGNEAAKKAEEEKKHAMEAEKKRMEDEKRRAEAELEAARKQIEDMKLATARALEEAKAAAARAADEARRQAEEEAENKRRAEEAERQRVAEEERKKKEEEERIRKEKEDLEREVHEPGWRRCVKCSIVFYGGDRRQGTLPENCECGGTHQEEKTGKYAVCKKPEWAAKRGNHVDGWLWCYKCNGLFIDVDSTRDNKCGVCTDGKAHDGTKSPLRYSLPFVKPDDGQDYEEGFVWCSKCSSLVQKLGAPNVACKAGGKHDVSKASKTYSLYCMDPTMIAEFDQKRAELKTHETAWRVCGQCQGVFYGGDKHKAISRNNNIYGLCSIDCKADHFNYYHGNDYMLVTDKNHARSCGVKHGEGWRWCNKCGLLFIDADSQQDGRAGVCPAGDQHDGRTSQIYYLPESKTQKWQQVDFQWCFKCSCLFNKKEVAKSKCPAGGQHDPARARANYAIEFWPF